MDFPDALWPDTTEREMVHSLAELFGDEHVVLTDKVLNSVWFSPPAEALFGDRGAAIVNRAVASLLGFDANRPMPPGLEHALLGQSGPWKALLHLPFCSQPVLCEASAAQRGGQLVCGVLRLRPMNPVSANGPGADRG